MKKILFLFLSSILVFSCTKDFAELNTDPTSTSEVPTSNLLTGAIQQQITINAGLGYNKGLMFYVQHWAQREETGTSRYGVIQSGWSSWYSSGMPELYNIIELNEGPNKSNFTPYGSNNNQIAVARIMRAWAFHNMTDAWGNIPYFDVGNPAIDFPKYDDQRSIYVDLFKELKEASAQINVSELGVKGDLLFDGDMAKWKTFANSLRARLALRVSKVDPDMGKTELAAALTDGVISSNAENAVVAFQEEEDFSNPLFLEFKVQQWTYVSDVLVKAMSKDASNVDPRLAVYADNALDLGYIQGLPYGLTDDKSTEIPQDSASHPGAYIRSNTFPSILCTASEMLFIQAEAVKLGWISGDAKTIYEDAIRSNMDFWGIGNDAANTYLTAAHVAYDDANWKQLIGEQKWVSFYTQGAQAWAEYRRIGYPVLNIPTEEVQNDATEVPRRYFYPKAEKNTNGSNLNAAISAMGGDGFSVRVWWDQ